MQNEVQLQRQSAPLVVKTGDEISVIFKEIRWICLSCSLCVTFLQFAECFPPTSCLCRCLDEVGEMNKIPATEIYGNSKNNRPPN